MMNGKFCSLEKNGKASEHVQRVCLKVSITKFKKTSGILTIDLIL